MAEFSPPFVIMSGHFTALLEEEKIMASLHSPNLAHAHGSDLVCSLGCVQIFFAVCNFKFQLILLVD